MPGVTIRIGANMRRNLFFLAAIAGVAIVGSGCVVDDEPDTTVTPAPDVNVTAPPSTPDVNVTTPPATTTTTTTGGGG